MTPENPHMTATEILFRRKLASWVPSQVTWRVSEQFWPVPYILRLDLREQEPLVPGHEWAWARLFDATQLRIAADGNLWGWVESAVKAGVTSIIDQARRLP